VVAALLTTSSGFNVSSCSPPVGVLADGVSSFGATAEVEDDGAVGAAGLLLLPQAATMLKKPRQQTRTSKRTDGNFMISTPGKVS
jgi:hypothetical protein